MSYLRLYVYLDSYFPYYLSLIRITLILYYLLYSHTLNLFRKEIHKANEQNVYGTNKDQTTCISIWNMKMAAQTGHSRRADLTPISIFVLLYHVLRSSSAFNPIDPDHSRFNFANVHLELHPESITNNIWPKEFDRVGKYCQDSGVGPAQGKLCIPKYEEPTSFRNGCDASEYRVCDKYNGSIAMVERGGCTMSEKAKAAEEHSITGLIIIETLNVSNPSDLQGSFSFYTNWGVRWADKTWPYSDWSRQ